MSPHIPASQPGFNAHWFAARLNWRIRPGTNVVLEGEHDERYFRLANKHYQKALGLRLLGDGFEVFAAGSGDSGGTFGIQEHFHTVFKAAQMDWGKDGQPVYRIATLLDDDRAGQEAAKYLTAKFTGCLLWRDVFRLQRRYPTDTRDLKQLDRRVRELNNDWINHNCEIEDLLPKPLIDLFYEQVPNCYSRDPEEKAGRWHFEFKEGTKGKLCTFVEKWATPEDLQDIIEVIKALRFFLSIKPKDGSSIQP